MNACDPFLTAFSEVTGTGSFHSTGTAPFFLPKLMVKGLGELAFPLPPSQAEELKAFAETAPYGLGEKTVLDETVRKCWQLDASRFSIKSPQWKRFLKKTTERVREDLGVTGKISASPYKLLLYETGGHFRAHRDTEKLDAMFGTLVIALPSAHAGGRLFIRHDGREVEVDFSKEEHSHEFQHAAFFVDCEHEVEKVRSGFRCCLVYNLHLDEGDPEQLNLSLNAQARSLLSSLAALKKDRAGKLSAVLLEHQYTEANLSLRKLKGNDQARGQALMAAAKEAGCSAHLALVTYHQMGELEGGYSRYDEYDDGEGSMGEIYEEELDIAHWRNARDRRVALGAYRIEDSAIISRDPLGKGDPDEEEAEGFTGNAGCTMDYWFRRAAVVLWAEDDHERILCRYNLDGACKELADLAGGKKIGPGSRFHRLGEAVVACYPDRLPHTSYYSRDPGENRFAVSLDALATAHSRELLDQLLERVPASAFVSCGAKLWKKLHKVFGVEAFGAVYETLAAENAEEHRRTLFQILDALLVRKGASALAGTIAGRLAGLAPKEAPGRYRGDYQEPTPPGDQGETRILLAGSHLLNNAASRKKALAFLRADSSLLYLREGLAPVLLERSLKKCLALDASLAPELLAAAKKQLHAEVNRSLGPYPDWIRPCPAPDSGHGGKAIRELVTFMANPEAKTHDFRRHQGDRSDIENYIREHRLDLDHETIKKGRPYTLACTKNDRSYHRALARRAKDEALLEKLRKLK